MKKMLSLGIILNLFLIIVLSGCGGGGGNNGGSGNGGDGGGGGIDRPVTADDYLGTWLWKDSGKCPYSVQFTVGPKIKDQDGGSYHSGLVECDIFLNGIANINGDNTDPSDPSVIDLLIQPHGHSILIRAYQNIAFDHTASVYLSGQLTGPSTISIDALSIWESGGADFSYHYNSTDHDDEFLLFIKQP